MPTSSNGSKSGECVPEDNKVPKTQGLSHLPHWYTGLRARELDIVGDFLGHGLLAIHGESLLTNCLANAEVDFRSELMHPNDRLKAISVLCIRTP